MYNCEYTPILKLLFDLLAGSHLPNSPLPAAKELFNEGSLLRIALALESKGIHCLPFHFAKGACWLAEPLLYSPFQATFLGDTQAERHTHADGVVGNVSTRTGTIRGLQVLPDAQQFIVIESKLFSNLSSRTTNAVNYDQAVRNVVCMAKALEMARIRAKAVDSLGFYVIAPQSKVGRHKEFLDTALMSRKVEDRISAYPQNDQVRLRAWKRDHFDPLIEKIEIKAETWELVIERAKKSSSLEGEEFERFYMQCLGEAQLQAPCDREKRQPPPQPGEIYLVDDELVLVTGHNSENCRVVPIDFEGPYFPPSRLIATSAFGQPVTEKQDVTHCRPQHNGKYWWDPLNGEPCCPQNETTQPEFPCEVVVTGRGRGETARVETKQHPPRSFLVYPHHLRVEED